MGVRKMKKTFLILTSLIFIAACVGGGGGSGNRVMGNGTVEPSEISAKADAEAFISGEIPFCLVAAQKAGILQELNALTSDEEIQQLIAKVQSYNPTVSDYLQTFGPKITANGSLQVFFKDHFSGSDLAACNSIKASLVTQLKQYLIAHGIIGATACSSSWYDLRISGLISDAGYLDITFAAIPTSNCNFINPIDAEDAVVDFSI